jgi:hypothetical protein
MAGVGIDVVMYHMIVMVVTSLRVRSMGAEPPRGTEIWMLLCWTLCIQGRHCHNDETVGFI